MRKENELPRSKLRGIYLIKIIIAIISIFIFGFIFGFKVKALIKKADAQVTIVVGVSPNPCNICMAHCKEVCYLGGDESH